MTLTVADIERWSAGDVREVFHAASSRAQAARDAANGLADLPALATGSGVAADAARRAIGKTRKDLDAHGNEALAVASAARKAATEIDRIQSDLRTLKHDAEALKMAIDSASGKVVAGPGFKGTPAELASRQGDLQPRLDKILADANAVDAELANAIRMADGSAPIPNTPHDNRPEIQQALSQPLPQDPQKFEDLWNQLTPEEKDWLYAQDPSIANNPGMPWDPPDGLGKDHYNRLTLDAMIADTQANIDRIHQQMGDLAGAGIDPGSLPEQMAAATYRLTGLQAAYAQLNPPKLLPDGRPNPDAAIPRYLGLIDNEGHVAIALQNPDHARATATFVPGTGQDINAIEGSVHKSLAMYRATLDADSSLRPEDVSVTTWMDYNRPMSLPQAANPIYALADGDNLDAFQQGLRITHEGAPSLNTVIGHSYGSTLVGAAGAFGNHLDADNVIAVGSPGMLVSHSAQLDLAPGAQVYAMRAEHDIISLATGLTLGPDPTLGFGATVLDAAPGPATWGIFPSVAAHSSYWDVGNPALTNMGEVIAGHRRPPVIPSLPNVPGGGGGTW